MAIFDERLIAPSEQELTVALGKAMKAANRDNKHSANRMSRDSAFWGRFAQDVLRSSPEGRRRSSKGGRAVPEVVAGWWTDLAGRKHVRIVGRTRHRYTRLRCETEMRTLPPWWHVYPEAVLGVRGKKEGERFFAVCRCGAVGTPASLGWMGDTCGPCFDRRADGGTTAGGFGQFNGWSAGGSRFAFTSDGQYLVGQNQRKQFWKLNRTDGTAVVAKRKTVTYLALLATTAEATTFVMQEGSLFRWPADSDDVATVLPNQQLWGRILLAPNGSRVVIFGYQTVHRADLTEARPKYTSIPVVEGYYAMQFTPDGSQVLAANYAGEILSTNPTTMAVEILRRDAFDGLPPGYGPPTDLAVSPDASTLLVRREAYQGGRRRACVRHVPIPTGKVVELHVPDWHHPATMTYTPDGRYAVTAESESGWVGFFDVSSGKSLGFVRAVLEDLAWRGGQVEFAPDSSAMAVSYNTGHGDHGGTVAVWPWPATLAAAAAGDSEE